VKEGKITKDELFEFVMGMLSYGYEEEYQGDHEHEEHEHEHDDHEHGEFEHGEFEHGEEQEEFDHGDEEEM
jgi:hypothetical protein